ncbi:MAG: Ca2+-dependent phosphoinositide-specific phospholipase C [Bacteroidota bacterium]
MKRVVKHRVLKLFNGTSLKFRLWIVLFFFAPSVFSQPADSLRINQVQVFMSHNSYRLKTYEPLYDELKRSKHPLCKAFLKRPWDYSHHTSLDSQLTVYGMRGLELDIYYDPNGGLFYQRKANKMIDEKTESGIEALKKPGMKLMHIPDFDYMTQHYTFTEALHVIKKWSDQHPGHLPLFIMVEAKNFHALKFMKKRFCSKVLPFTKNAVDSIDLEIKSVFGENTEKIITPDKIRGKYKTLNEAVLNNKWPLLSEARGKIIFLFMAPKKVKENYLENHFSLSGRIMFTYSDPGKPEAAFIKLEKPERQFSEIQQLVKQGYMVRTRADANTKEARRNSYERMNKALLSGAHLIATDYYIPDKRSVVAGSGWSNYKVAFQNGNICRKNPLNTTFIYEEISSEKNYVTE